MPGTSRQFERATFIPPVAEEDLELLDAEVNAYVLGNTELPIAGHRSEIEAAVLNNPVTILMAPTGSGKTTQVPQFARELGVFDEIIVTQPRIVAARTISARVADEIASTEQDHAVGYYTSKEASPEPQRDQHIAFLTDGKAAAQLLHASGNRDPHAQKLLIIDEVHEWNIHIELLIAIAAEKTNPASKQYDPNLKVVIMSATMDGVKLKKYFSHVSPPLIEVKVPMHEVKRSVSSRSVADVALRLAADTKGKVLAFHAGKREIKNTTASIAKNQERVDKKDRVVVVPLHGQLPAEEQQKAFEEYPNGSVVATTNAAETSLTVPGAIAVVDSGEVRTDRVRYDLVATGSEGLYLEDASQANLLQRAGRVGRTAPGEYILTSQNGGTQPLAFEHRPKFPTPAIQRTPLDGLVLSLKASGYEPTDFRFFHEPPVEAIEAAKQRLFVLGAIDKKGVITERGKKMERLPLEPEYACMLVFAQERGYSDDVKKNLLDIVAIMQRGGILKRAPKEQRWRDLIKQEPDGTSSEKDSDFFVQLEAYVELMRHIPREEWEKFDIIEHSAELVEQGRESLARVLGVELHEATTVAPKHRQEVLASINAGQLNQLWRRNGERWGLLLGSGLDYELAQSSVVRNIGQLATGKLFSLGLRDEVYDNVQNVNRVPSLHTLEVAAEHLITEVHAKDRATYDAERHAMVVRVQRKLGPLVLRTYEKEIDAALGSPELEQLRNGHREHAWNTWPERRAARKEYAPDELAKVLLEPEVMQYGTDPVTGEPLLAWRGGKGQWCRTRDVALQSLEAYKQQLEKRPTREEQREVKAEVKALSAQLIAYKKKPGPDDDKAKVVKDVRELLSRKSNSREWVLEAKSLLGVDQSENTD
jgi:HrpA-like RNA helicase